MSAFKEYPPTSEYLELLESDPQRFIALVEEEFDAGEVVRSPDDRYLAIKGRWIADLSWESIQTIGDWLARAGEAEARAFGIEERDFNEEFWMSPRPLYHATDTANRSGIEREGLRPDSRTRGISNRRVGASVFTSTEPDELDSYGPLVMEVDTTAMKRNGLMPRVSQEPDVEAADTLNRLAQLLGCDDYQAQIETGISEETVIVHGALPAPYLRVHREPMLRKLPVPDGGPAFSR